MISGTLFVFFVIIGDKVKKAQISAEAEKGDSAICTHRIAKAPPNAMKVKIGEYVTHRWSCAEEYGPNRYSLFVRNCDQIERNGQRTLLTDKFGCTPRNASNAAVRLSLNYSLSSAQHNANESVLLTVSGYSLLRSFPFEGFFRIECTLSLLPKVPNVTEFPNCSQNLSYRENSLNNLLTPSMAHQKRFIDMVETNVSSDWIEVENERKNEKTLAQNSGEKEKGTGTKQRRQFGVWHDQMPISGESEEVPAMALSPFLARAYSIFATSLLASTPPSTFASFSTSPETTEIHSSDFAPMSMSTTPSSPAAEPSTVSTVVSIHPTTVSNPTAATSAAIINQATVFNTDKSIVSEATTHSIHTMESQTSSPFLPSIGLLRAETPFPFEKHLPAEEATTKKSTENEAKMDDNSFGGGNGLTAKMEEIIRGFVPLFVGQNSTNSSNSNSTLFHNLSTRQCSWTMLNTALLVWSIFSTLHWLCLLAAKLRSSVVVRRRLKISPKQRIAVAKMSAMKRKMMGPKKHCGGIKQRKNLIEYPNTSIISKRDSPAGKRRSHQKALRTVRQRHLLHRTMAGGGMAPMGAMPQGKTPQNEQKKKKMHVLRYRIEDK